MQTQDFNSDARPLPAGWTQHFEPTKQLWYYVQTSVMPPKVSFTHPLDMVPANRRASPNAPINNTHMPQPQLAVSPMQTPQNPSQSGSGLTFAQQLYASSMTSLSDPMINSHSIPPLPTSQLHIRNLPTPPPSSSPSPGAGVHFPNTPVNGMLSQSSSSHTMNRPTPNFNSTPSSAPPFSNQHGTNTFQTPNLSSNNSHPQRHRASTYDQGMSQHSANVNPLMAGPRPTRHLVTMARPPDQQSSSALSPLLLEPPVTVHSAPAIPSPPPSSSILFLQATGTHLTSPLTPPLTAQSTPVTPSNISSVLSVPSGTAYNPQSSTPSLGRVASGSAILSNGGAAQSLGVGSLADGIVGALQSVLLTPSAGVDHLSLQAVIQGRPDADYQRIINALIKLHQHQHQQFSLLKLQMPQPPPLSTDYRALITEVRRLQALAQAQQVTTAQQQQLPQFQTSAQLQAEQQQQQQQQTAAQQYQALVQQRYQQQAAIQQHQQQQAAQYQALFQQQQQQATIQAQQNQALLQAYPRPPQQPQQSQQSQQYRPTAQAQSTVQTFLEVYNQFQNLNQQSTQSAGAGDTGGGLTQPSFDPTSLYSNNSGGGELDFSQPFAGNGSQVSGGFSDFLTVSFSQDNSAGLDMTLDISGQ